MCLEFEFYSSSSHLDSALLPILGHQVSEYPTDPAQTETRRDVLDHAQLGVGVKAEAVLGAVLRRLVDRSDDGPDAQRDGIVRLVEAIEKPHSLIPGRAPVVEEAVDDRRVLEHDVIHVTDEVKKKDKKRNNNKIYNAPFLRKTNALITNLPIFLPCERYSWWCTLGTKRFRPRWMVRTVRLDAAVQSL